MTYLSDSEMDAGTENSDWEPWDIKSFERFDRENVASQPRSEEGLIEEFKALYEQSEIKEEVVFKKLYSPDTTEKEELNKFTAAIEKDDYEEPIDDFEREELVPDSGDVSEGQKLSTDMDVEPEPIEEGTGATEETEPVSVSPEVPNTEEIEKKAYEEGFQKGEADGLASGKSKIEEMVNRLHSIINDVETLWPNLISANEEKLISLILKVSEKIVLGHVALDNEMVRKSVLEAFQILPEPETVSIFINNEDYEYIENIKDDIFQDAKNLKQISIISDSSVSPGGCRIESEKGDVDATIETRLRAIQESIIAAANNNT